MNYFTTFEINLDNDIKFILTKEEEEKLKNNIIDINKFIRNNIKITKPSFYQKKIFVSCLLSQIDSSKNKKDIDKIAKGLKRFTQNYYSNILKEKIDCKDTNEIIKKLEKREENNKENNKEDNEEPLSLFTNNEIYTIDFKDKKYDTYDLKKFLEELKDIFKLSTGTDKLEEIIKNKIK